MTNDAYDNLLQAVGLTRYFDVRNPADGSRTLLRAVDGVDLNVRRHETMGVVGESGCGKSTLARLLLRLIEATSGTATFDGIDLYTRDRTLRKSLRRRMNIVFQDPYGSLDPRMSVLELIAEPLRAHGMAAKRGEMIDRAASLLEQCGISADQLYRFAHQFSGGQRQRICIARALAAEPEFVVCDEAVSALDVSIQAQILNLLVDLKRKHNLTYLFISHDLSVVRYLCDRVLVMYLGQAVEQAPTATLFTSAEHPYTQALLASAPDMGDGFNDGGVGSPLLDGDVPSPMNPPSGCRFHTRCVRAEKRCADETPLMREIAPGHWCRCHLARVSSIPQLSRFKTIG
ncbi:MAG: ABC transporter ATP-binding protein [Oscillospiraceae bacterium]|jgi:oligopeptide/dipeptide ABC transporter ATP-binding protein|nr:ABC transporter ATP-binding protein [Oscillospiraceae bacterium]